MKKLDMDLELLIQSFSFNSDDLGKEYVDTHTGDIINIPSEVMDVVMKNGNEDELDDWQKELLKEAYDVKENLDKKYVIIPTIEDRYYYDSMMNFVKDQVCSEDISSKLLNALQGNEPIRDFKSIIFKDEEELEKWHNYEEQKLKEYAINWLNNMGIELK